MFFLKLVTVLVTQYKFKVGFGFKTEGSRKGHKKKNDTGFSKLESVFKNAID